MGSAKQPSPPAPPQIDYLIEVLDLSERAYNGLKHAGIDRVSQVLALSDQDLLDIPALGVRTLGEIRQKLEAHVQAHPEQQRLPAANSGDEGQPLATRHRALLVPVELCVQTTKAPLEEISIARLLLPPKEADFLLRHEVSSVGALLEQPADAFAPDSLVPERVDRYLQWLVVQDEETWCEEVTGQRISPMHYLLVKGKTLDEIAAQWLRAVSERDRRVLKGRFAGRTLEDVGQEMGLSRERIRQIEERALKRLKGARLQLPIASLSALLAQAFEDAGGLMAEDEACEALIEMVPAEAVDVTWIARLLLTTADELQELPAERLWGLTHRPLHLVPAIRSRLTEMQTAAGRRISGEELVSQFAGTELWRKHQGELDSAFVAACYRTMLLPSIPEQMPMPEEKPAAPTQDRAGLGEGGPPGTSFRLYEWEQRLRPLVGQVELLGEIPLTQEETAELGRAIGAHLRGLKVSESGPIFRQQYPYPCSLAVFLAAQGVYGYSGIQGYWPGVGQAIGKKVDASLHAQLGQLFETILTNLGLPRFPDLGGHRFVTLILLHGGIPDYCLPDFFANMLQPGVTKARYAGMSAAELMEEWRWRASGRYATDKPVLYFLEFGGLVAQDFVERCLEMARETADSGSVPEAEELGLPPRVVVAYSHWVAEQDVTQVRREAGDRWRLRKPEVRVDPWGEGILLDLPPQQVPVTAIHADIAWQVQVGEEMVTVPVRVRRSGFDWKTVPEAVALRQPAAQYEATLLADGEPKRGWPYQGVDETRPILAFDLETGALLSWTHSLPARRLALFYPAGLELSVEGQAHILEEYDRLPRGWASYRGQAWDLRQARALRLASADEGILTVALRADEAAQRPFLEGGRLISPGKPGVHASVYLGVPPCIRIPLSGRRALEEELALWRVTIQNRWAASPEVQQTRTLTELRAQVTASEGHVDLLLHHAALLGRAPFGNYQVRLRGPLGRDADLSLRLVPYLKFSGHEKLYLPDPKTGPQPAMLQVETLAEYGLECQGEEDDCRFREVGQPGDKRRYEVEVSPDTTAVDITLVKALPTGDAVRVPVPAPIRRLRWRLLDEGSTSGQREWSGAAVKEPVDAFLQAQAPCLLVELPIQDSDPIHLQLRLVDVDGIERQVLEAPTPRQGQQRWRFELGAFADTVRHAWQSPVLRLELEARGLRGEKKALRWPVLSLTRTLLVENVKLQVRRAGKRAVLELEWHEPKPLRNRVVRFWPLWRPWDAVFEQAIPDDAQGTWAFEASPGQLRSGKYRLQFVVVDPWVPQVPQKPAAGTPGTVEVELIAPQKQREAIEARIKAQGERFEYILERAVLSSDMEDPDQVRSNVQWCYEHLDEANVPQILALVELVQADGDPGTMRALQLKMFAASRFEPFLHAQQAGTIPQEQFDAYLANLPRSGLLPQATCRLLLTVEDETARLHAVQQLLSRGSADGVEAVLAWVEAAKLSDDDAVSLLAQKPDFAAEALRAREGRPTANRLLQTLSQKAENVVRVGSWLRCNLGWGRIDGIEHRDTGAGVRWCIGGSSPYRLTVTLRPDVCPETVIVDLLSSTAEFPEPGYVRTCTECEQFSTQNLDLLSEHHLAAHRRGTYQDRKYFRDGFARFRIEEIRSIPISSLEFVSTKPAKQLV